ncbi:MAG: sulfite exporter TauE/SafE family protein, partial [Pseudomonadota bacterium]
LAFCPVSAALFFGSLIPLSIKYESAFIIPLLYGVGTAMPVIVFAFLMAFGAQWIARAFGKMAIIDKWARRITGALFLAVGVYFSLVYMFGL